MGSHAFNLTNYTYKIQIILLILDDLQTSVTLIFCLNFDKLLLQNQRYLRQIYQEYWLQHLLRSI